MTDQTPTPEEDAPDFSWSGETSALSTGAGKAWQGLAAAPQQAFTASAERAGQTPDMEKEPAEAATAAAPQVHQGDASDAPHAGEAIAGLLSGRWALAAGLALAAGAVLLLTGGPGNSPWGALGALGLGAAVVGGFWAGRGALPATAHREMGDSPHEHSAFAREGSVAKPAPPEPSSGAHDDSEIARLEGLLGALPELGLLMDAQGRADMVFGKPLAGVGVTALHEGVPTLATDADRPALMDALRRAAGGVPGQVSFALAGAPERRLSLSLSRTPTGDIAGILVEAPRPAAMEAAPKPEAAAETGGAAAQAAVAASHPPAPEAETVPTVEGLEAAQKARTDAEAERDAAKADSASKSRFLANMSHELRTPLNAIIGFSDIMRTKLFGPLPERYAEYAELIHESGRHLTDLINDILDMSKLEADRYELQRETFDAREPISSALKLLRLQADDKGVHLRGDLPAEPLTVDADRRALKQIVLNLVSNALKFTPPEGRVDVTLRAQGGALELVVADTGVGIAAEDLKRLGTPYEQTDAGRRAQGTGLGLSLVKALTALHGGEFSLESRLGEGSAATVRLPVLVQAAAAAEPAPTAS